MSELITLVDEKDRVIGGEEKITVHRKGLLHRAFSVLIFTYDYKKTLLQRRHPNKYHSGGLWSNTVCGHPRYGEELHIAVHRRLKEEMDIATELEEIFTFHYYKEFDNGLIENEIDHVFIGEYDGFVSPEPTEVIEYKWINLADLQQELKHSPEKYTYWFRILWKKLKENLLNIYNRRNEIY